MHRVYNFNSGTDNGNVITVTDCQHSDRTQNFDYDSLNRIKDGYTTGSGTTTNNWGETYTIDAWGNLTTIALYPGKQHSETLSQTATTQNRLTGYSYDSAGNRTQNGSTTYTYDAENRITATSGYSYVYDGDGERVIKCSGTYPTCATGTLYWRGNAPDALTELTFAGAANEEYTFFGGKRVARRDGTSETVHYYFSDHLGSTDLITGKDGGINKTSAYYPYGGEIAVTGPTYANNYKFTGKERDNESGLDFFGARFYGFSIGRWMNPDLSPLLARVLVHPQRLNRYAYVINNPLSRFDPDGNSDISIVVQRNDTHAVPMQGNHRVEATTGSYKFSVNGRVMDTGSTIERGGSQRIPSGSYSGHYTPTTNVHAFVELENVKDPEDPSRTMTGVRGHAGNYPWDSKGCPLVGADTGEAHGVTDIHTGATNDSMMVTDSDKTADELRDMIKDVIQSDQTTGEPTNINVQMIDPPADAPFSRRQTRRCVDMRILQIERYLHTSF